MTLLDRDLDGKDIKVVIMRNPYQLVIAADSGEAILAQQSSHRTREEAENVRNIMNQDRPDNVYALGPSAELSSNEIAPNFHWARTGVWAGPFKDSPNNVGMFRKIMEAMR